MNNADSPTQIRAHLIDYLSGQPRDIFPPALVDSALVQAANSDTSWRSLLEELEVVSGYVTGKKEWLSDKEAALLKRAHERAQELHAAVRARHPEAILSLAECVFPHVWEGEPHVPGRWRYRLCALTFTDSRRGQLSRLLNESINRFNGQALMDKVSDPDSRVWQAFLCWLDARYEVETYCLDRSEGEDVAALTPTTLLTTPE